MPFIAEGQPQEPDQDTAQGYYQNISPSFSSALGAEVGSGVVSKLGQAAETGQYKQGSWFDKFLASTGVANSGFAAVDYPYQEKDSKSEYQQIVAKQKLDQTKRDDILGRYQNAHSWPVNFATGLAGFMLDLLQASSALLPGADEGLVLRGLSGYGLGEGLAARTGARLIAGATGGAIGQAPVVAAQAGLAADEGQDYGMYDAFRDLLYGAAAGAILHSGLGGLHEAGVLGPDEAMRTSGEIQAERFKKVVNGKNFEEQKQAVGTAVSQITDGRPVEVRPIVDYNPETMEDKDTLVNNRNLILRSLEALDEDDHPQARAELEGSLKDINNKLYATDLRDQEKAILDRVNGHEEELEGNPELADKLSLIRQEIYSTVNQDHPGMSPSDVSTEQQKLYSEGYQQGTSQQEITQAKAAIEANGKEVKPDQTLETHMKDHQELVNAFNDFAKANPDWKPTEEDVKDLTESQQAVDSADDQEKGMSQAANCLNGAGV